MLCEKPFTLNRREAETAVALARRHDVFLMEAMWMRYVPAMVELKRLRRRRARSASRCRCRPTSASPPRACRPRTARSRPRSRGGGLLDIGIYPLNLAAFVLGDIVGAQADAELGPTGVDVHTVFNLRHAGGQRSQGMCSLRVDHRLPRHHPGHRRPHRHHAAVLRRAAAAPRARHAPVGGDAGRDRSTSPGAATATSHQVEEVHRCLRAGLAESPVMPLDETVALVGWMDTMRAQFGLRYPGE